MPTAAEQGGVVITGAGQGIGQAAARLLAARGWAVGCLDLNRISAEKTCREIVDGGGVATVMATDVTERAAVQDAIAAFGEEHGIRALVNNAMWIAFGPFAEIAEGDVDRMLAVGIKGAVWCSQAALPYLAAARAEFGDAAIVNVASAAAFQGTLGFSVYAAVKGALVSMSRQNAVEFGSKGIRVNAVAPGPIPTDGALDATIDPAAWRAATERRTPLQRMGTAEEVASVIAFLCGRDSSWVNGQAVGVDGGRLVAAT